ncbi:MAG: alpha/beta fold hydrolase [Verrucomicrobia bacterium]|nr:alpha/beta fold hydrolase [Verrucomicrobiota bacterium]
MRTLAQFVAVLAFGYYVVAAEPPKSKWTAAQRLETARLQQTREAVLSFERARKTLPNVGVYEDFRAVIHVHAEDSDHTKGTRPEVLAAAKKTGVRVVMWTDHRGPKPETWRGLRDGVLFIAGSEDGNGVLRFPDYNAEGQPLAEGGLRFLSHIEERYDASSDGFAGMEISNRHSDAVIDKSLQQYLLDAATDPSRWRKLVEDFKTYPDEFFAAGTGYRAEFFSKWDQETKQKPFAGIAANDAHQNQVFQGTTFDPYEVSFRNLCTHILARELTEPEIRQSLREGHVYVSHDWLCDPTGFAFGAVNNLGVFSMGDAAPLLGTTRLVAVTPIAAKLRLFHNGAVVHETEGTNLTFQAKTPGAYRVEAWLSVDEEDRPWIYSNPVYVKAPSLDMLALPSMDISPNVEVRRDLVYTDGPEDESAKHKLDLYLPKEKKNAPVFVFIHGGAWRSGDRAQYVPIGNRFAKEGILTVAPSYRLAPKFRHPAQIEDVAAAFAWVVRHIAEHGGDTNRIYIGGHSAGGHLAALLALDERYLAKHQLTPKIIRGTIALSGVYNLAVGEGQASVFGNDPQFRREASPLFHVKAGSPPFLISYCQWDYPTLPAQAREFNAALRKHGVPADLLYVPRESHISEMIAVAKENDVTATAILKFLPH